MPGNGDGISRILLHSLGQWTIDSVRTLSHLSRAFEAVLTGCQPSERSRGHFAGVHRTIFRGFISGINSLGHAAATLIHRFRFLLQNHNRSRQLGAPQPRECRAQSNCSPTSFDNSAPERASFPGRRKHTKSHRSKSQWNKWGVPSLIADESANFIVASEYCVKR